MIPVKSCVCLALLFAVSSALVARNVRIEGQQFVESKTNEVSRYTLGPSTIIRGRNGLWKERRIRMVTLPD